VKTNQSSVAAQRNIQDEVDQSSVADEKNVGVSDGFRKKSIGFKPTGKLLKIVADMAEHGLYKLVVLAVIIIASLAMASYHFWFTIHQVGRNDQFMLQYLQIFETSDTSMNFLVGLLAIEIFFTVFFFVIVVYDTFNYGTRNFLRNPGGIFEVLIVLVSHLTRTTLLTAFFSSILKQLMMRLSHDDILVIL